MHAPFFFEASILVSDIELSIIMPCLNEAATIKSCVEKALNFLRQYNVAGEVIVADNGSIDGSQQLAASTGAIVIHVIDKKGYGIAIRRGIETAKGRFIVMGDADDSYDFSDLSGFISKLREGDDLVMGNRFIGHIEPGAMPFLHRYLGNPVLSLLGRKFFRARIGDFHCGLRAFNKKAIQKLGLTTTGMEFASEMIVKAALAKLRITEIPTTLSRDGRNRPPHLRTWRDGWRHLRFLLLFSPRWLFLYPGMTLLSLGIVMQYLLHRGGLTIGTIGLDIHTMLYTAAMSIIGLQMVWFAIFSKVYGISAGFLPKDNKTDKILKFLTLERGVILGCLLFLVGLGLSVRAISSWASEHFGALDPREIMRLAIPAVTFILAGSEIVLASFFLSVLQIDRKDET